MGLAIDAASGTISGIPTHAGVSAVTVTATNAAGSAGITPSITIAAHGHGGVKASI